ncbi:MAG: hypothetical protein LBQ77_03230 [Treponema sp.]|jgi:hypothetical protein|nr:hypothetical protein [Treponema sp.]
MKVETPAIIPNMDNRPSPKAAHWIIGRNPTIPKAIATILIKAPKVKITE